MLKVMIARYAVRLLMLFLSFGLVSPIYSAQSNAPAARKPDASNSSETRPFHLTPGPDDGLIAFITARLLEDQQYLHHPLDAAFSSKFLDGYLETLDPQHIHFLQSDLNDFELYRTNLDMLTKRQRNANPAFVIFDRFIERYREHVAYVENLLKTEEFTFTNNDRIVIDRHELPYPKDLAAAKALWKRRLRFEYLQELLGKIETARNAGKTKSHENAKKEAEEIVKTIRHRYERNLLMYSKFDDGEVMQMYLTALTHVYDPHSDYLGHEELQSFAIAMNLSLCGIGAELEWDDGYCTIRRLLTGGPAIKSKQLHPKDRIIAVAQSNQPPVDVVDMPLPKAVQLIRGAKGTEVRLTIIPAGADASSHKIVSLIRDDIPLEDQAAKAQIIDMPDEHGDIMRLGVIELPSFYAPFDVGPNQANADARSTSADVKKLLNKLKQENVAGVILDLRNNGGGSLDEAIKTTGLFIKKGPVVQVRDSDGDIQVDSDRDPSITYDGPLIVLTSRFSASASEILAGALQDYGRALIVGDASTHGKGTVQSVLSLVPYMQFLTKGHVVGDPGALKITIKKFYRPSGASTQLKGVTPDIILPSVVSLSKDFGESSLENPLPWDTIASAKFDRLNMVAPYLPELRKRDKERLATDPEYGYIRQDIALFKKQEADKTISLNEKQRLKEQQEAEARQKARDKERLARKEPSSEKEYDISLAQAGKPGLPPAVGATNTVAQAQHAGAGGAAAVVSANSPLAAASSGSTDQLGTIDPPLNETEHILMDYVSLMSKAKASVAAAGQ